MGDTYQLTAVATTAPCSSMTGPLTLSLRIHCRINIIAEPPATGCCFQTGLGTPIQNYTIRSGRYTSPFSYPPLFSGNYDGYRSWPVIFDHPGVRFTLNVRTANWDGATTSNELAVAFEVGGEWTNPSLMSSFNDNYFNNYKTVVSVVVTLRYWPTNVRLKFIGSNQEYGYDKVWITTMAGDEVILRQHPAAVTTSQSGINQYYGNQPESSN